MHGTGHLGGFADNGRTFRRSLEHEPGKDLFGEAGIALFKYEQIEGRDVQISPPESYIFRQGDFCDWNGPISRDFHAITGVSRVQDG